MGTRPEAAAEAPWPRPEFPRLDQKNGFRGNGVVDFAPSEVVRMGIN